MITRKHAVLLLLALVVFCSSLNAQSSAVVPRLVNFSGIARDERGNPISGIAGATFAIHKEEWRISALARNPECPGRHQGHLHYSTGRDQI
jgi:hypothetical protein